MKRSKKIKALPFGVYFWSLAVIAGIGLTDAVYLTLSHYWNFTDIHYASFCAYSRAINCDTVSQSSFSVFLGLPVALWGAIGYSLWLLLLVMGFRRSEGRAPMFSLLLLLALIFCAISLRLAYVSVNYVHASCIMCFVSWSINFALLFLTWITRKRFNSESLLIGIKKDLEFLVNIKTKALMLLLPLAIAVVCLYLFIPRYWVFNIDYSVNIPHGIDSRGYPWIGAENPDIIIEEFSDYLCFQCAKMHFYLRRLVQNNPKKVRLVHRHFPMDHEINDILVKAPYHVGSAKLSMVAIYAAMKDRFWEVNDYFFLNARHSEAIDLEEIALKFGLNPEEVKLASVHPKIRHYLKGEIRAGTQLEIVGTPTYLINGELYQGQLPKGLFKDLKL